MSDPLALLQNVFYISINFNCILYGVELVLYFMTVRVMLSHERERVPADKYFLLFSTILLFLSTIFVAIQAVFGEEMWIVNANYPGGADAYFFDFAFVWYQILASVIPIISRLLSDGLLIYRCYVVWDDIRIVLLPILVYLATLSLGIAELCESARGLQAFYSAYLLEKLVLGYISCTIGLEVVVTSLISARIYFEGKKFSQVLGAEVGRTYTGAAAIMVESMLLSTLTGIPYLVSFALESQMVILFVSIWLMALCIAPQLVVYRVIAGRAWTRNGSVMLNQEMEFASGSSTRTRYGEKSSNNSEVMTTTKFSAQAVIVSCV